MGGSAHKKSNTTEGFWVPILSGCAKRPSLSRLGDTDGVLQSSRSAFLSLLGDPQGALPSLNGAVERSSTHAAQTTGRERPVTSAAPIETPTQRLASLSSSALRSLFYKQDMCGPASHLFSQSVNGQDFLELDEKHLVNEVRVTPFVAKKLLRVRAKLVRV